MAAIKQLLGDFVEKTDGEKVPSESLGGEGKVVGLYFSAHWCPPCRGFTPILATKYNELPETAEGKFDIVFVSSDKDEKEFSGYFKDMPWKALPFSDRKKKAELSTKFKVQGIPTLVLVDGETGKTITTDGRSAVTEEGATFPFKPKTLADILLKPSILNRQGDKVDLASLQGKVLGLYFSAHWCGPCRSFTPVLVKTYNKLKEQNSQFEIVFVSSDRDEASFKEYYSEMPWLTVKYDDKAKKALSSHFKVSGIPHLVILDYRGDQPKLVTANGRMAIGSDPDGKDFPWYPKPFGQLTGNSAGDINESPALIWFTDKDQEDLVKGVMTTVTDLYKAKRKTLEDSDDNALVFLYHFKSDDDDDIGDSLRGFAQLGKNFPMLALIDIPAQKVYNSDKDQDITAEFITSVVNDYSDGKLSTKPLKQ